MLALSGLGLWTPATANAAVLVAQATPAEACRNLSGRIEGDYCMIDVTFCEAATLAAEGICKGREGEIINLDEIVTGPREKTPSETRG
jgi:hypothetical protein